VSDPSGQILLLRVPPPGLLSATRGARWARLASVLSPNGVSGWVGRHPVSCFWIGLGRRVRVPGPRLLERLRDGSIADLVDVGCAGALDPSLRRGDLVLSREDVAFDTGRPVGVSRRPEVEALARKLAEARGAAFRVAPILTHERAILDREARLELFHRTGCAAVQMEHAWLLRLLQSLLPEPVFRGLQVTHLTLITDAVPGRTGRRAVLRSGWDATRGYLAPERSGIASLRRELLTAWPAG
jgi:hypothetical protein